MTTPLATEDGDSPAVERGASEVAAESWGPVGGSRDRLVRRALLRAAGLGWFVTPAGVVALYLAVRLVGVAVLWLMLAAHQGVPPYEDPRILKALTSWDGGWYLGIALDGYPTRAEIAGGDDGLRVAFFPLYPYLVSIVHTVTFLPVSFAGLLINIVAGSTAAVFLFMIGRRLYSPLVGLVLMVLWAAHPAGLALSMTYAEAVFCALAFGGILLALRERWLAAGLMLFVAGLARGQGLPLAVGVVAAVAWLMWRERRPLWRSVRNLGFLSVGLLGFPAWAGYVAFVTGRLDGWSEAYSRGWGSRWEWFAGVPEQFRSTLLTAQAAFPTVVGLLLVAAVVLLIMAITGRVHPILLFPGVIMMIQVYGSSMFFHTKPRLLLPVVALLIPIALAITRLPRGQAILTALLYVLFGAWFGAYAIVVYYLAI